MSPRRTLQVVRETAVRLAADAVIAGVALLISLFVYFIWLAVIDDSPIPHQVLAADLLQRNAHSICLLVVISLVIYAWSGFYGSGRSYQRRYKARVIVRAVTVSYLLFIVFDFVFPEAIQLPPFILLLACCLTLLLMVIVRLWHAGWAAISTAEQRLYRSEVVEHRIKNVLVIGGAGYIGSALLPKLLDKGYHVRLLDLLLFGTEPIADLMSHPELEIVQADFRQVEKVVDAVRDMDAVIHLGAIVGDPACALDEELTIEVNLIATRMIAEVAKGSNVRRLIFASTCSVYGASDQLLDEHSVLNPVSLYARSKIASEKVLRRMADDYFTPVILRFGTIYGLSGRTRFDLVINLLTAKAVVENQIPVFGGDQWRPFVHVDDSALAVLRALEAPRAQVYDQIFNVGSDAQNYTIQQIGEIIHGLVPAAQLISKGSDTDRRNYRVRFNKIRNILGFVPQRTVAEGVQEVIEAIKSGQVQDYRDAKYSNVKFLGEESVARRIPHDNGWVSELLVETMMIQKIAEPPALTRQEAAPAEVVPVRETDTANLFSHVDLGGLLHRDLLKLDLTDIAQFLAGATVLITGAGGSVGGALCHQVARFAPREIIPLDHSENSLAETQRELRAAFPSLVSHPIVADIRDPARINSIIQKYRPTLIFHRAGYHCPDCIEMDTEEAITSNVVGTQIVLEAAERYGVGRFVLISSIKATDQADTFGMSKRLAELLVTDTARRLQRPYLIVRLGNLLDSQCGMISVFLRQIAAGKSLTLTHANMRGYFMTIAEAVQLACEAAAFGHPGEVFVLDMDQPIRILDLLTDSIKACGLEDGDIHINYSGIRPGERLHEELFLETETCQPDSHPRIFIAGNTDTAEAEMVARMVSFARQRQTMAAREQMQIPQRLSRSPSIQPIPLPEPGKPEPFCV
jgi:FlaA1/EpsC-like NDP-sugar epimerase